MITLPEALALATAAGSAAALFFRAGGILRELRQVAAQVAELRAEVKTIGEGYRALRVEHEIHMASGTCPPGRAGARP